MKMSVLFILEPKMTVGELLLSYGLTLFYGFANKFEDIRKRLDTDASYVTVFAPTNEAFGLLSNAEKAKITGNDNYLRLVLKHHISLGEHKVIDSGYGEIKSMADYPVILRAFEHVRRLVKQLVFLKRTMSDI